VVIVDLPAGDVVSEIGVDRAGEIEVGWVGAPARLLVLSRRDTHTTAHLLDPHGPESIAEIQLASAVALYSTVGAHALVIGAQGAAILTAGESHLTPYQFPARAKPTVAGAAANQFVVAIPGTIEEWDPQARVPKRRLRLPRPTTLTAVGGSERVVWMIAQQDPTRIDVLPLINRGQPKTHELPEPIAAIAGHPRSDLLACIGADTGRAYAIDLDGRTRLRSLTFPGIDRVEAIGLVVGRTTGVVAAQRDRPIAFVPLEARDPHVAQSAIVVPTRIDEPLSGPVAEPPPPRKSALGDLVEVAMNIASKVTAPPPPPPAVPSTRVDFASADAVPAPSSTTSKTAKNLAARFAAVRERREMALAESASQAAPPTATTNPAPATSTMRAIAFDLQPRASWRDDCVAWARDIIEPRSEATRDAAPLPPPAAPPIDELAARFELSLAIVPALALVYGAHLAGHDGVAPADIARVLDRRWDEALGRGELAASGIATYERSRVRFAPAVQRILDELPPATGTLVGTPNVIALLGACVIVERGGAVDIATNHASRAGGAILVGHDDRTSAEVCFEARAIGAAAMLPASKFDGDASAAVIYVADDEGEANRLGLPRFA